MTKTEKSIDLKSDARQHTAEAFKAILEVMNEPKHKDRLRAAQEVLNRAYGPVDKQAPPEVEVAQRFLNGQLSASDAALLLQSYGQKVPHKIAEAAIHEERRKRVRTC